MKKKDSYEKDIRGELLKDDIKPREEKQFGFYLVPIK